MTAKHRERISGAPRYEIQRQLGSGGIGAVYLARDLLDDGREVALKVCRASLAPAELLREFRILRELRHPGLARAFDVGQLSGGTETYFTMEYVRGSTLAQEAEALRKKLLAGDPLPLLAVFCRLGQTLSYVHRRGLIHLDVKPTNVVLTGDGHPKLIDFGLFQTLELKDRRSAQGTLHYCAPEIRAGSEFDHRADLYSLGVTLRHVLSGGLPAADSGIGGRGAGNRGARAFRVDGLDPKLGEGLLEIMERLVAPSPAQRFDSAEDFVRSLTHLSPEVAAVSLASALREADFCARRSELEVVLNWLDTIQRAGGGHALVVEGEPGIGKSRFLERCSTEALCAGFTVLSVAQLDLRRRQGLQSLVRQLCTLSGWKKRNLHARFAFLLTHLGLAQHAPSRRELGQLKTADVRARVVRETLHLAAGRKSPLLICVDGLDPGDADLVELVRAVSNPRGQGTAVDCLSLGVLTTRYTESELDFRSPNSVTLKRLGTRDLLQALTTFVPLLGRADVTRLARASQGNPGLLRQLLYHRLTEDAPDFSGLVGGLDHVVAERIKKADDLQRALFLHLSLLCEPMEAAILAGLLHQEVRPIQNALRRLEGSGFLVRGSRGAFLVRILRPDTLGKVFSADAIRSAHKALGELLATIPERQAEAAHHFFLAGMGKAGLELGATAIEQLGKSGRISDAIALAREALLHASSGSALAATLLEQLADLSEKSGQFAEAAEHCREALATNPGRTVDRMRLERKLAAMHQRVGNNAEAEQSFARALEWMEQTDDLKETLFLLHELVIFYLYREEFSQATAYANRGLELLRSKKAGSLPDESRTAHSLRLRSAAGHVLLRRFDYEGAARELRENLKLCERVGSLSDTAQVLNNLGVAYYQGNRLSEALRVYARATTLAKRMGNDTALFSIQCNVAAIRARRGEMTAAREGLRAIYDMPHARVSQRAKLFLLYTEGLIARLELTDAQETWTECVRLAATVPDPVIERYAGLYAAENEIQQGRWKIARDLLEGTESRGKLEPTLADATAARRVYLDALCYGQAAEGIPVTVPRALPVEKQGYADVWNWIYLAAALTETGRAAEAEGWLRQARSFFSRLRQHPGVLECDLALTDGCLRRGETSRAGRYLSAARKGLRRHDSADGSRAALPRLALLEARLALQSDTAEANRLQVSRLLASARDQLTPFRCFETAWLIELVSKENGDPGAEERERDARQRFLRKLRPVDRRAYAGRDHLVRLGLRLSIAPSGEIVRLRRSELRLQALAALEELREPDRALSLLLSACAATTGALFAFGTVASGNPARTCLARRGTIPDEEISPRQGRSSSDWVCVDIMGRQGGLVGQLVIRAPARSDDSLQSFLQLAAKCLTDLVSTSTDLLGARDRQATPLLVEALDTTLSLAARTLVTSNAPVLQELLALIQRTRDSELPVLLTGESGVGKDRIARWIHSLSPLRDKPFLVVDCSSIPDGLWEAELFGHERGAFTGADMERRGYLLAAQGGTVYLDHVDSISSAAQAKLLRVLEDGEVRPVGAEKSLRLEARFIASSQRDLRELTTRDEFRSDLYYRLSGISVTIPPLRERAEDISALVRHFRSDLPNGGPDFTADGIRALQAHSWPGNIRELETLVRRLALTADETVDEKRVNHAIAGPQAKSTFPRWIFEGKDYKGLLDEVKREYLLHLVERYNGDVQRIAAVLGTGRRNVYLRFAQLGLKPPRSSS